MSNQKKKICIVITARPSYARVRTAMSYLQQRDDVELQVIGTASFLSNRFGSTVNVLEKDGFKLSWEINSLLEADTISVAAKTTSIQLGELATAFQNLQPDMVMTIADRYETIATAIAASYMNIPLVHLQGGEVTGNIDEKVRHAITKLADLHLASNTDAAERIQKMGEREDIIHITGCPSIDIAREVMEDEKRWQSFVPYENYNGVGNQFDLDQPFVILMQHPVTSSHSAARSQVNESLEAVYEAGYPAMIFWPNPDSGTEGAAEAIRSFRERVDPENFYFFKNLKPGDFLRLLLRSKCLIGNSSVGIRECSYLGVPVVNIGDRQIGRLRGQNVVDVPQIDKKLIVSAIKNQVSVGRYSSQHLYGDGFAGKKIADVLATINPRTEKRITY